MYVYRPSTAVFAFYIFLLIITYLDRRHPAPAVASRAYMRVLLRVVRVLLRVVRKTKINLIFTEYYEIISLYK